LLDRLDLRFLKVPENPWKALLNSSEIMCKLPNHSSDSLIHDFVLAGFPENISIKRRLEGDILILMSRDLTLEFADSVAADFITLIDGKRSLLSIITELSKLYDADISIIKKDILELCRLLQRKRVIRINSQPINI